MKSADFFDAVAYPKMTFVSNDIVCKGGSDFEVSGNLTIRGTTKPVTLQVEFGGIHNDFYGNTVAGFELNGKINRQEFGLTWSAVTEAGGIVVSDDVKLNMNVELHKKG